MSVTSKPDNIIHLTSSNNTMKEYQILVTRDEDGRFVVTCPDLQGVATDGATEEEAMANARYAISEMLEFLEKPHKEFSLRCFPPN